MPFSQIINNQSFMIILSKAEVQNRTNESVFDTGGKPDEIGFSPVLVIINNLL